MTYSNEISDKINAQIPQEIITAMTNKGWNALGIYELVKKELKNEKEMKRKNELGV